MLWICFHITALRWKSKCDDEKVKYIFKFRHAVYAVVGWMRRWYSTRLNFSPVSTTAALIILCYFFKFQALAHERRDNIPVMAATPRSFVVVVAAAAGSLGIGKNGALPWRLAGDMAYFKKVTSTPTTPGKINAVIMGRKTWQSIPERFRPLAGRRNVVLSRNPAAREELLLPEGVLLAGSLAEALALLARGQHAAEVDKVFVIGGGSIYKEALGLPSADGAASSIEPGLCEKVLLTSVRAGDGRFDDCDVHFPAIAPEKFKLVSRGPIQEEKGVEYSFDEYESVFHANAGKCDGRAGAETVGAAGGAAGKGAEPGSGVSAAADAGADADQDDNKENTALGTSRMQQVIQAVTAGQAGDESSVSGSKRKAEASTARTLEGPSAAAQAAAEAGAAAKAGTQAASEQNENVEDNEEEMQYLKLVEDILENGVLRGDRTGTGTLSKFGVQMRFSLRDDRFPLLTTKRVFWRGVAEELLWFISGCTNASVLKDKGIHIWDGNGSREFLDG